MKQTEKKQAIIKEFKINDRDTGSIELQVALLTDRINALNGHAQINPKDQSSKHGLIKLVGRRRSFLDYLHRRDAKVYETLIARLELRK